MATRQEAAQIVDVDGTPYLRLDLAKASIAKAQGGSCHSCGSQLPALPSNYAHTDYGWGIVAICVPCNESSVQAP
jgi:hypothetical protein